MVKLRLKRMGTLDKPFYRIVTLDSRKKRDGIYLESIGYYDPKTDPFTLKVDTERAIYWLGVGAQPSATVRSLLKKAGILQKWHEMKYAAKVEEAAETEAKEPKKKSKKVVKKTETAKDEPSAAAAETVEETPELTEEAAVIAEETAENAPVVEKEIKPEEDTKE